MFDDTSPNVISDIFCKAAFAASHRAYIMRRAAQEKIKRIRTATLAGHAMIDEVYNRKILFFAGNIERIGVLENADASATAYSRVCGSTVTVYLKLEGDRIADFSHEVKACALGQASSSIMARQIIGCSVSELRVVRAETQNMLSGVGGVPGGRFADIECLLPVREHRARHASVMLTFDAVVDALDQVEHARMAII